MNLRFRAWDISKKQMLYEDYPFNIITSNKGLKLDATLESQRYLIVEGDFNFMQSTGFADSKGNEIFESDVIEIEYSKGEVYWNQNQGMWAVRSLDTKNEWSSGLWHYCSYCLVVGHIFE